jgi:hypothetical protein
MIPRFYWFYVIPLILRDSIDSTVIPTLQNQLFPPWKKPTLRRGKIKNNISHYCLWVALPRWKLISQIFWASKLQTNWSSSFFSFLWDKKNVLLLWVYDVVTCCIHFPFCVLLSHFYEIYDMYIRIFSSYHIWLNRSLFLEIFHRVLSSSWFFPITLGFSIGWLYI